MGPRISVWASPPSLLVTGTQGPACLPLSSNKVLVDRAGTQPSQGLAAPSWPFWTIGSTSVKCRVSPQGHLGSMGVGVSHQQVCTGRAIIGYIHSETQRGPAARRGIPPRLERVSTSQLPRQWAPLGLHLGSNGAAFPPPKNAIKGHLQPSPGYRWWPGRLLRLPGNARSSTKS